MELETMYSSIAGNVATVVLNRPEVLNCVNEQWVVDFDAIMEELRKHDLRVVVLRGAGRAFCSGIDLTALSQGRIRQSFFRNWEMALRAVETMEPIAIAAVHSHCIGGGLQLALACDLRIARDDALFALSAAKEGIVSGLGVWRVARHAGLGRAKQLALTAESIDAGMAWNWGLVDYVENSAGYETRIKAVAERVLGMPGTSSRLTKKLITLAIDSSFADCLEVFCEYQRFATESTDYAQAMATRRSRQR